MNNAPDTLRHGTRVYGAERTSSIERIVTALLQERNLGRGVGGWCVGSREAVAPEMDIFLWLIDYVTQRRRIEPGGGGRVRGGTAME